jgi:V8-like Glu-specific endopeptidase
MVIQSSSINDISRLSLIFLLGTCTIGIPTMAQSQPSSSSSPPTAEAAPRDVETFWTPDRLRNAKPMELQPKVGPDGLPEGAVRGAQPTAPEGTSQKGEGSLPKVQPQSGMERQLVPMLESAPLSEGEHLIPEATSSFGARFTTGRVFPDAAVTTYPFSAVGKLFFTDPKTGGNFVCSASVLRPRIIATAGHCVTHPSTNAAERYFFSNFLFVPAYNNGGAPFRSWTSNRQWVANAWYFSNGSVPNEQDVAMLIANDQLINGQPRKIGEITGWLGYFTNQLSNNNATMLGYPCNLDSCARMEITNAQTFASGGSNTFVYGSAMRGGASGGPWVQDFGVNPVSNPTVPLGLNYLIAVTSYGPVATEPKYLGASNFDARFLDVLSNACASNPGNC